MTPLTPIPVANVALTGMFVLGGIVMTVWLGEHDVTLPPRILATDADADSVTVPRLQRTGVQ